MRHACARKPQRGRHLLPARLPIWNYFSPYYHLPATPNKVSISTSINHKLRKLKLFCLKLPTLKNDHANNIRKYIVQSANVSRTLAVSHPLTKIQLEVKFQCVKCIEVGETTIFFFLIPYLLANLEMDINSHKNPGR